MERVTISDIAARAGLSTGAVSYALNNKPGVSEETRRRVHDIATELGWSPSRAARALSTSRADTIGLVLARPARLLGTEPFYMEFIAGVEDVIAARGVALMLHIVPDSAREIAMYDKWWSERRVDGVLVVDLTQPDARIPAVERIGIPAIAVGSADAAGSLAHVTTDDATAMREAVRYLLRLGHRRIARVSGPQALSHTAIRDRAFLAEMEAAGHEASQVVRTDFSGEAGSRATRSLLTQPVPPTAIIYDNDIMAVAGLSVAAELGVVVPAELSLLAWDDSPLCEITHPPLSAMKRDVSDFGALAARMLLELIDTGHVESRSGAVPALFPRATTAAPARP
jgi:DNA-binding LacI/PurR family transcriptional regulator